MRFDFRQVLYVYYGCLLCIEIKWFSLYFNKSDVNTKEVCIMFSLHMLLELSTAAPNRLSHVTWKTILSLVEFNEILG